MFANEFIIMQQAVIAPFLAFNNRTGKTPTAFYPTSRSSFRQIEKEEVFEKE